MSDDLRPQDRTPDDTNPSGRDRASDPGSDPMHDDRHQHDDPHAASADAAPTDEQVRAARATAFVLGELDAAEHAAFEAEMAADPALAAEVEAVRAMAGELEGAFAADAAGAGLTDAQRERVTDPVDGAAEAPAPIAISTFMTGQRWAWAAVAAAACVVVVLGVTKPWEDAPTGDERESLVAVGDGGLGGGGGGSGGTLGRRAGEDAMRSPEGESRRRAEASTATDVVAGQPLVTAPEPSDLMLYSVITVDEAAPEPGSGQAPDLEVRYDRRQTSGAAAASRIRRPAAGAARPAAAPPPPPRESHRSSGAAERDVDFGTWSLADRRAEPGGVTRNRDAYAPLVDNPFRSPLDAPFSTFSIDVDTASYSNMRRMLAKGQLPPADAIRIEELVNYFDYDEPAPSGDRPLGVTIDAMSAPWSLEHRLVRVALQAEELDVRPQANLVFLLDVSGSMNHDDKLPLVKASMRMLVDELEAEDRVAMVVYAGASGLVLDSTPAAQRETIVGALDRLNAGGSTNGGAGIRLAYDVARRHFIDGGVNRVILCTDGDFNVGVQSNDALQQLIEQERESGVFLSVLGFGTGNWKDDTMEQLSNHGNGVSAYIDSIHEARRVLVDELTASLVTVAKDVKLQVEFNPGKVQAYRLIGYANRMLRDRDFNDDTVDAGDVGAGHSVTALYEIVPTGVEWRDEVDDPKYQRPAEPDEPQPEIVDSPELLTVKLRWKAPEADDSELAAFPFTDDGERLGEVDPDFRFAAGVAAFGMTLRNSPYRGDADIDLALELARSAIGEDPGGWRAEFVRLAETARSLKD